MNFDFKKFVMVILSAVLAALGGNAYQTSHSLNDVQKSMSLLSQDVKSLSASKIPLSGETEGE